MGAFSLIVVINLLNRMDNEKWKTLWTNEVSPGFHRYELCPPLVALESDFLPHDKALAIFVPFCGKALEMKYFHDKGFKVIGLELSEDAINHFAQESGIELKSSNAASFGTVYQNADSSMM